MEPKMMRELPIYKVIINIEHAGRWVRCFAGRPTEAEILSAIMEDQSNLASDETGGIRWDTYDNWMTMVRDHKLPESTT